MRYIFLWYGSDFMELFQPFRVPYQLSTLTGFNLYGVYCSSLKYMAIMYAFYLLARAR